MSSSSSVTWSAHVRIIFQQYRLPDPLLLLSGQPWPKERWKSHTKTAVTAFHEAVWRDKAANNYKLKYLNVQCTGLSGRPHPVLSSGYKLHKMWKLSDHISSFCVVIISVTTICVMTEVLTPIVVFALPYLTTTQLQ